MAEAWNWYRAIFRVKLHVMRRGSIFRQWVADRNCSSLRTRIAAWAADRRTNVLLIRRALDDVLPGELKPEWDAFSLKADYIDMMKELDKDWGPVQQGEDEDQQVRIGGEPLPPGLAWIPYAAKRYVWNEPERSRRVLRLAFANWLARAAGELYKRDRGAPGASDQTLVGPYLDELPADGSPELDDGSAPTIREDDATASPKEG